MTTTSSNGARNRASRTARVSTALLGILAVVGSMLIGVGALTPTPAQAAGQQVFDGPNGTVRATAVGADGTTYVGGDFTQWGPQTGGGAGLSASNGAVARTLPPVTGTV